MATKKAKRKVKHNWYLVLQRDGNSVRVQPDWTNEVKEGDTVSFVSPDGTPMVTFEYGLHIKRGKPVEVVPLAKTAIKGSKPYRVLRSSAGTIECSLEVKKKMKDGKSRTVMIHYPGYQERDAKEYGKSPAKGSQISGATYCWKGTQLVRC